MFFYFVCTYIFNVFLLFYVFNVFELSICMFFYIIIFYYNSISWIYYMCILFVFVHLFSQALTHMVFVIFFYNFSTKTYNFFSPNKTFSTTTSDFFPTKTHFSCNCNKYQVLALLLPTVFNLFVNLYLNVNVFGMYFSCVFRFVKCTARQRLASGFSSSDWLQWDQDWDWLQWGLSRPMHFALGFNFFQNISFVRFKIYSLSDSKYDFCEPKNIVFTSSQKIARNDPHFHFIYFLISNPHFLSLKVTSHKGQSFLLR